jgi:AcrR family transcriptional regulator
MDKQEKILNSALKLFVEFGFHGTPTSKIAQLAGVSNGTLFHYFKTKDELVVTLYETIKEQMGICVFEIIPESGGTKILLEKMFKASLTWAIEHKTEFLFIQQFHSSPYLYMISSEKIKKIEKNYTEILKQAIDDKIFKPLPVDLVLILINNHVYGVFQYLISSKLSAHKQKQLMNESFEMLWKMLT